MDILWSSPNEELSARDVTARLGNYATTTIATVLDRLSHKGIVRRRREGRFVLFSAVETRVGYAAALMREALATTERPAEAIVEFVRRSSREELATLSRVLSTKASE
jgi:predicted transcriptional regulator